MRVSEGMRYVRFGLAAGCEAGLCPAVKMPFIFWGSALGAASGPVDRGAKPKPRAQPKNKSKLSSARGKPAPTSGGIAETNKDELLRQAKRQYTASAVSESTCNARDYALAYMTGYHVSPNRTNDTPQKLSGENP